MKKEGGELGMKGDDIAERLIDFAVRIIRLGEALPKNQVGKHVAG